MAHGRTGVPGTPHAVTSSVTKMPGNTGIASVNWKRVKRHARDPTSNSDHAIKENVKVCLIIVVTNRFGYMCDLISVSILHSHSHVGGNSEWEEFFLYIIHN